MTFRWDIVACSEPDCDRPAESVPMHMTMNPAGGVIVHRRVRCVDGHVYYHEVASGGKEEEEPPSTFSG